MKIVEIHVHECRQALQDPSWKFARATVPALDGYVLALHDEAGHVGLGYVHAIPAISTHGEGAKASVEWLLPWLRGRSSADFGALYEELDARLAFNPTVKAGVDMALHDLVARQAGLGLHALMGGKVRDAIPQARILAIKSPGEMASKAATLTEQGYGQLKLKLAGHVEDDAARVAAVRQAVGSNTVLTLDPNQSYTTKGLMALFARIEKHDIALIEQPVPGDDWAGMALLTRTLPVAIEADESAKTVSDVFRLVSDRVVDVVNVKITKFGGIRRYLEAVKICEAGGVICRVGAAFGPALLQANATHAASILKSLPYACELSEHEHLHGDPFTPLPLVEGMIHLPPGPGCGVVFA